MHFVQELVEEFHAATGGTIGEGPMKMRNVELRMNLIEEEFNELDAAVVEGDLDAAIDALADLTYVIYGTAVAWNVPLDRFILLVHEANMRKLRGPKREDGKQLKPEGWQPPDIRGLRAFIDAEVEAFDRAWNQIGQIEDGEVVR